MPSLFHVPANFYTPAIFEPRTFGQEPPKYFINVPGDQAPNGVFVSERNTCVVKSNKPPLTDFDDHWDAWYALVEKAIRWRVPLDKVASFFPINVAADLYEYRHPIDKRQGIALSLRAVRIIGPFDKCPELDALIAEAKAWRDANDDD